MIKCYDKNSKCLLACLYNAILKKKFVYYQGPEFQERFMRAMHCMLKITARDIATAFDLSKYSTACDLGGMFYVLSLYHSGFSCSRLYIIYMIAVMLLLNLLVLKNVTVNCKEGKILGHFFSSA